jgi:hypothetical protein
LREKGETGRRRKRGWVVGKEPRREMTGVEGGGEGGREGEREGGREEGRGGGKVPGEEVYDSR